MLRKQGELLDIKTKELDSVQRTVKTAVENIAQAEIKSYSAAVSKHSPSSASTFTVENLKKVVQNELLHFTFTGNIHAFWSLNYHFGVVHILRNQYFSNFYQISLF